MSKSPIKSQFHKPSAVLKREQTVVYQGPLPPPEQLEGFEKVLSGSAERIISMAEKEQEARIGRENQKVYNETLNIQMFNNNQADLIKKNFRINVVKTICAALCLMVFIAAAVFLAVSGHDTVAIWIFAGSLGTSFFAFFKHGKDEGDKNKKNVKEDSHE